MKRHIKLLLCLSALFYGCAKDTPIHDTGIPLQESVETTLTLRVSGSTAIRPDTRALEPDDENKIDEIDILVFSKPTEYSPDEAAVYSYRAQTTRITGDGSGNTGNNFRVTLKKNDSYQRLVVFANARSVIEPLIADLEDKTYAEAMAGIAMTKTAAWNSTTNAYDPLPMWGQSDFKVFTNAASAADEIELIRSLARIDVVVGTDAQNSFTMSGVWLYNPSTKGLLAPSASNWNAAESEAIAVSLPSEGREAADSPFQYTTLTTDDIALQGVIYTFEAPAATGNTSATDACLVVKGSWNGEADSYYRIDFHNGSRFLPILRNFHYNVSIDAVSGRGYPNEPEAISSGFTAMTATTQVWNKGNMGSVVWDGSNYLAISANEYTIYPEAQTVIVNAATNYQEGWKATATIDTADGTGWLTIGAGSETGVGDNAAHAINMTILTNTLRDRTAIVTVTAGRLKQEITITQKVNTRLSLDVGDVEVIFSAENPEQFSLPIEWEPAAKEVALKLIHAGTDAASGYPQLRGYNAGVLFSGDNTLATTLADADGISTNGGSAMLSMLPDAANLATFEELRSILEITSDDGMGNRAIKTVLLRQFDYAIQVLGTPSAYQLGTTYSVTLKANAQWEVIRSGDSGQIVVPVTEGEPNTSGITFNFTTGNTEGAIPVLTFRLKEHTDVNKNVNVVLYRLDPNCYIVHPEYGSNSVTIPIRKVYDAWANDPDLYDVSHGGNPAAMAPESFYTTKLSWQDKIGLINGVGFLSEENINGTFTVTVNTSGIEGNAVAYIAENGVIRWSWHIWVLKSNNNPATGTAYTNLHTGAIIMDRDLGATANFAPVNDNDIGSYGLMYQWGRKDPLPGAAALNSTQTKAIYTLGGTLLSGDNGFRIEEVGVDYNLANSIMNPLSFYSNTSPSYYDSWWYSSKPQSVINRTNLWNNNHVKTIYDPCPEGWRVPVTSFLDKVVHNANDYTENSGMKLFDANGNFIGFFPMSGYMSQANGSLNSVGNDWYGRIAAVNQGMAITSINLTATAGITNGRGLSVRCVKVR